jgi:hypothetical protein
MSFVIVHVGRGQFVRREVPGFSDPTQSQGRPRERSQTTIERFLAIEQQHRAEIALSRQGRTDRFGARTLIETAANQCKWLDGDICCGRKARRGSSWCDDHYAKAFPKAAR